jgi:hypothetical protein
MKRRTAIAIGLVVVTAAALAVLAVSKPWSDDAEFARHRGPVKRAFHPERSTPKPTDEPAQEQHGSSQGPGVHIEGSKTEHHNIHGSGSIAVTSGAVDPGTGGKDANASLVGPRRPRRTPRN